MDLPKRKPTRLYGYDYSTPGAYFVTICTYNLRKILSEIVGDVRERPLQIKQHSVIANIVGYLKMNVTKKIHETNKNEIVRQRLSNDHIIRGEKDYQKIWEYIDTNVLRWKKDCFYIDKRSH